MAEGGWDNPSIILNASPNAGLCRACLRGCHPAWHLGCRAACCCAPLLLLIQGLGWICPLSDTSALLPLISWDLQGTPQPAQSRGLLKKNFKEGNSKLHVGTGEGPAQARRFPAASQRLACFPGSRMEPCIRRAVG